MRRALAVTTLAFLALGACGDDDAETSDTTVDGFAGESAGDGTPPEEPPAECYLMEDYQGRPVVVASAASDTPVTIYFDVTFNDGHTESFTQEFPDYQGRSAFVEGAQSCTVTAVR